MSQMRVTGAWGGAAVILCMFFCAHPASAQIYSVSVTGLVTDPNGAVIPAAKVTVRNTATDEKRVVETGVYGRYTVSRLAPGPYEVSAESPGFKTSVQTGLQLAGGQAAEINLQLTIGQVSESIEVTASPVNVDTQTANQTLTFGHQDVLDMPVNNRTPLTSVHNTAGVVEASSGQESGADQNQNRFAMNGSRELSTLIMIDGVVATAADWGGLFAVPSVDSTSEVQVQRNSYDAEYGRSGGGVVSIISRGGSGEFHGTAFDFFRNDNLDANTWERNRNGAARPEYKRNQFGGNISGPILRRKRLFFFFGYEGRRSPGTGTLTATVPSLAERQGDFSQSFNRNGTLQTIFDPFSATLNSNGAGYTRQAFSGNRIPASRFDPVGAKVLSLFPNPNRAGDPFTHALNFFGSTPTRNVEDRYDARVDWTRNEKFSMYGRFTYVPTQDGVAALFFGNGADTGSYEHAPRSMATVAATLVPTPRWVISVVAGYGAWRRVSTAASMVSGTNLRDIGLPTSFVNQVQIPALGAWAFAEYNTLGNRRTFNNAKDTRSLTITATHEMGDHSLKTGFLVESAKHNFLDEYSVQFNFNRGMTSGPAAAVTSSVSGNSIASALLGTGSGGSLPLNVSPAVTQNYYAWFFQDSWRVNKRLTLNLGLRYELQRPRSERFDRGNYFDFEVSNPLGQRVGLPLKGGLVFITPEDRYANRSSYTDLAPRFGFAYKVTDKLVLRGGYGIMFGRTYNLTFPLGVDGYSTSTSWVYSVGNAGILPQDRVSNPYPNGLVQPSGSADGLQTLVGNAVNALPRPNPSPYIQNYSFDVQHQIGANAMFEIGYSGNIGKRLIYGDTRDANQLNPSLLALGSELDRQVANPFFGVIPSGPLASRTIPQQRLLRARPQFSEVLIVNNEKGAYSRFDSLFTRFQARLGRDLTLISSYQFSRMLDNASSNGGPEGGGTSLRNYFDPAIEYGTSGLDVPHSFVTQGIYHLPVGRDKALGSTWPRLLDTAFGGWQLSAVFRLSSGLPLDMTAQNTLSPYGFHVLRPNYKNLSDLEIDNPTPDRWFNPAAVIQPSQYSIGTGPRFLSNIRQSGPKHVHLGIFKNFQITEQIKAQFRAEMFNLTNTPRFAAPNANLGSSTFGQVTATAFSTPRQVQLGLKLSF